MQVVMGACEHVHCVDHGETIAEGTPAEVQSHPAVLAAYLGDDAVAAAHGRRRMSQELARSSHGPCRSPTAASAR